MNLADFVTEKLVILQNKAEPDRYGNIVLNSELFEGTMKMLLQAANGNFPENQGGCSYTGHEQCAWAIRSNSLKVNPKEGQKNE